MHFGAVFLMTQQIPQGFVCNKYKTEKNLDLIMEFNV